jgi:hypothetical protein
MVIDLQYNLSLRRTFPSVHITHSDFRYGVKDIGMSLIDQLANIIFPSQHQYFSMILVLQLLFFEDEIIEDQR